MAGSPAHPAAQLMAGGLPISEAVADEAAGWLTLLMEGGASEEDHRQWHRWRAAHPDHERAWKHIEAVTQRLKALEPTAGYRALSSYARPRPAARRKALTMLFWGAGVGVAGVLASRTHAWQQQMADYRSATGEQRTLVLADGSQVILNTASAIDVRFDPQLRLLRLLAGEVLVTSAHALHGSDDPRPLIVETAEGRVRALGTRFGVRQWERRTSVAVTSGAVEVTPAGSLSSLTLAAGERTSFTRASIEPRSTLTGSEDAWTRGQIVAADMLLGSFLAELDRYRPGVLRCDPQVAGLRVSGVFPLQDTERILASLPSVLPVRVRQRTRYWVVVEAGA